MKYLLPLILFIFSFSFLFSQRNIEKYESTKIVADSFYKAKNYTESLKQYTLAISYNNGVGGIRERYRTMICLMKLNLKDSALDYLVDFSKTLSIHKHISNDTIFNTVKNDKRWTESMVRIKQNENDYIAKIRAERKKPFTHLGYIYNKNRIKSDYILVGMYGCNYQQEMLLGQVMYNWLDSLAKNSNMHLVTIENNGKEMNSEAEILGAIDTVTKLNKIKSPKVIFVSFSCNGAAALRIATQSKYPFTAVIPIMPGLDLLTDEYGLTSEVPVTIITGTKDQMLKNIIEVKDYLNKTRKTPIEFVNIPDAEHDLDSKGVKEAFGIALQRYVKK